MRFADAIFLPILVSPLTKFISLNGKILVKSRKIGTIRIGFDGSGLSFHKPVVIHNEGTIILDRDIIFGGGTEISVAKNARLKIGEDVKIMGESKLISSKDVSIGYGCRISWGTQIMDTDFHDIYMKEVHINPSEKVMIGNRVWVCSGCKIYKGVSIADGCVLSADAHIHKSVSQENCIITGSPLKIIRTDIKWKP